MSIELNVVDSAVRYIASSGPGVRCFSSVKFLLSYSQAK